MNKLIMLFGLAMVLPVPIPYAATDAVLKEKITTGSLVLSDLFKMVNTGTFSTPLSVTYQFSGPSSDSVNYIRLCNATNNTCNSCASPYTYITAGTPLAYTTGGVNYKINQDAIAAYLSTNGLGAGSYNIGMYLRSSSKNCTGAYCDTNNDSNPSAKNLCVQATYNGTTVTALTQSDNGFAHIDSPSQFAYVANAAGNLWQCFLNADGSFYSCASTGGTPGWRQPTAVAVANVNSAQYAYVGDYIGKKMYYCQLKADGSATGCAQTGAGTPNPNGRWFPNGVSVATVGSTQYAYIADNGGNMYQCGIQSNGTLTACSKTPASPPAAWVPADVTIATVGGTQYAYVASNNDDPHVYQCPLNGDGTFGTCSTTPSSGEPTWNPNSVTITTVGPTQYAYVADDINGHVYQCTLNNNGTFNACTTTIGTGVSTWGPGQVSFVTTAGVQSAYVMDFLTHVIYQCSLNVNGMFTTCLVPPLTSSYQGPGDLVPALITNSN